MRKSIKRVAAFTLATVLAVSTLAIGGDVKTVEAASTSVNVITAEKNNSGDSIKYTYNKKGLVAKIVSKNSYKTSDEDVTETITTTYKYNKKNKVAKKTTKSVTKTKYYETDKTTGMKIVGTKGTVTDTDTTVTTYKYNKKGLATSSVATTTCVMSGSITETDKSTIANDYNRKELSDGRVIAGYNEYKADGTEYSDTEKAQSAYYYAGNLAVTEGTTVTTTSYADKGNGIYTETTTTTSNSAGYKTEPVTTYYGYYNGSVVVLTKGDFVVDEEYYEFQRPDGTYTNGYAFDITQQVNIIQDPTYSNTSTEVSTNEVNSKSVTTTTYTYDKKKRVKKAVATTVYSNNRSGSESTSESSSSTDVDDYSSYSETTVYSSKSDSTDKNEYTYEDTSVRTTTYTYDKKGRAKKTVSTNDGKENSKTVSSSMTVSSNSESSSETTTTYKDGRTPRKSTSTSKKSSSTNTYPTTTTTTVVNGVQTTTVTSNPYIVTYTNSSSYSEPGYENSSSSTGTRDTVTYANGGRKTTDTYTDGYSYNNANLGYASSYTTAGTRVNYRFDEKGNSTGYVDTYKRTYSDGRIYEGADAEYEAPGESFSGVLATSKIDAAKAALEASGSPFSKSTTKTVLATPSKATTTYSYDKNGNVKAANTKGTYTSIVYVQNETYGNYIYEFDANGQLNPKQTAVTHSYTSKDTNENTVKNGTNSLTKVLSMNKYTRDRIKSDGYSLTGRVTYTIKKKKSSAAKLAKKQQWILQNGRLNGEIGLD